LRTTYALIAKFLLTLAFAAAAFYGMERDPWDLIFVVAVVGTIANYLIGDLLILPTVGNAFAAIADGALASLLAWAVGYFAPAFRTSFASLAMFSFLVSIGEYFFHIYLLRDRKVAP